MFMIDDVVAQYDICSIFGIKVHTWKKISHLNLLCQQNFSLEKRFFKKVFKA